MSLKVIYFLNKLLQITNPTPWKKWNKWLKIKLDLKLELEPELELELKLELELELDEQIKSWVNKRYCFFKSEFSALNKSFPGAAAYNILDV